jgi:dihydrofolate reductase
LDDEYRHQRITIMRKIVVLMMLSLDGVMQAPGSSKEDEAEGFKYGGWTVPYADESFGPILSKELSVPFDLLLGLKTYQIWEKYWPKQKGMVADPFNKAKKYVVSDEDVDLTWKESILINDDVVAKLKALKKEDGPQFHVWGSSVLLQTLLKNDLVDELRLRIYPVTIGSGKRLFAEGTIPAAFELMDSNALPSGVILANYKRAGELKTGSFV